MQRINEQTTQRLINAADVGSRNMPQSGCIWSMELGRRFVTGPSTAPLTASALRASGQVQQMDFAHMICLIDMEKACFGTSSSVANHLVARTSSAT